MGATASVAGDTLPAPAPRTLSALAKHDLWVVSIREDGSEVHTPGFGNPSAVLVKPGRPGSTKAAPLVALRLSTSAPRVSRQLTAQLVTEPEVEAVTSSASCGTPEVPQVPLQRAPLALSLPKAADPFLILQQYLTTDPTLSPDGADEESVFCSAPVSSNSGPGSLAFCDVDRTPGWRSHVQHLLVLWDAVGLRGYQVTLFSGRLLQRGCINDRSLHLADFTFHSDEMLDSMALRALEAEGDASGGIHSLRFTTTYGNSFEAGPDLPGSLSPQVLLPVGGTFLKGFHGTLEHQDYEPHRLITLGVCTSIRNVSGFTQAVVSLAPTAYTVVVGAPDASAVEYAVCTSAGEGAAVGLLINGSWVLVQAFPNWTVIASTADDLMRLDATAAWGQGAEEASLPCPNLRVSCTKATTAAGVITFSPFVLAMLAAEVVLPMAAAGL